MKSRFDFILPISCCFVSSNLFSGWCGARWFPWWIFVSALWWEIQHNSLTPRYMHRIQSNVPSLTILKNCWSQTQLWSLSQPASGGVPGLVDTSVLNAYREVLVELFGPSSSFSFLCKRYRKVPETVTFVLFQTFSFLGSGGTLGPEANSRQLWLRR